MSGMVDRKVYDSDLRQPGRQHLLEQIAETYVREYVGNFEMMIEARWHLDVNGKLGAGMYRSVLNTLRCDPLRTDLWRAVQALLTDPGRETDRTVVPFERPPHREYGGHKLPEPRRKATFLRVRVTWKVPFQTAASAPQSPVVHLLWREVEGTWWRPRDEHDNLLMDRPLEIFEVRARAYCKSYLAGGSIFHIERPTYEQAFPGRFEPGDVLMPFCRSCVRLYLEHPELAVYQGEVQ